MITEKLRKQIKIKTRLNQTYEQTQNDHGVMQKI